MNTEQHFSFPEEVLEYQSISIESADEKYRANGIKARVERRATSPHFWYINKFTNIWTSLVPHKRLSNFQNRQTARRMLAATTQ